MKGSCSSARHDSACLVSRDASGTFGEEQTQTQLVLYPTNVVVVHPPVVLLTAIVRRRGPRTLSHIGARPARAASLFARRRARAFTAFDLDKVFRSDEDEDCCWVASTSRRRSFLAPMELIVAMSSLCSANTP